VHIKLDRLQHYITTGKNNLIQESKLILSTSSKLKKKNFTTPCPASKQVCDKGNGEKSQGFITKQ
jgi:hypothetical protein